MDRLHEWASSFVHTRHTAQHPRTRESQKKVGAASIFPQRPADQSLEVRTLFHLLATLFERFCMMHLGFIQLACVMMLPKNILQ